jgi:DNA polymerase-1
MPWRSKVGKNAILRALEDEGITPETRPNWPILKTGPSLGGQVVLEITQGTPAQQMGESLAELMGQRSLAQLALDSTQDDGFVHPEITSLQRSGRKSTTEPGLTVWTSRGDGKVEKRYFIADSDDHVLVGFDFSNADQRVVAALSGDEEYAKRFEPDADGHEINARIMFGDIEYDRDPAFYRNAAKAPGHASVYGAQKNKLAATTGLSVELMETFLNGLAEKYEGVTKWQWRVRDEGQSGWIVNDWGRRMVVDPSRSFTQSPALLGQSGTREIMVDALIRMLRFDIRLITWLKAQVHDELIFSIPKSEEWAIPKIEELMTTVWHPEGGQAIDFGVGRGGPARTWEELDH